MQLAVKQKAQAQPVKSLHLKEPHLKTLVLCDGASFRFLPSMIRGFSHRLGPGAASSLELRPQ